MGVLFTKQIHFSSLTDAAVPVGYEDSVGRISRKQKLRSPPPSSENLELSQVPSCEPQAGQSIAWRVLPTSRNPPSPRPRPPTTTTKQKEMRKLMARSCQKWCYLIRNGRFRQGSDCQHSTRKCFFVVVFFLSFFPMSLGYASPILFCFCFCSSCCCCFGNTVVS